MMYFDNKLIFDTYLLNDRDINTLILNVSSTN